MKKLSFFICFVIFIFVRLPAADAAFDLSKFERLVVFGDSLSDNGNLLALSGPTKPMPDPLLGFHGRFSNGPNWVDYFPTVAPTVAHFNPITAFYAAQPPKDRATNFAVGGSTSGDLSAQIGAYVSSLGAKSAAHDLCIIWIGANDFAAGFAIGSLNPNVTVNNIRNGMAQLSSAGARGLVVINVPDIALTPTVMATPNIVQGARQFVFAINALLEVEILPWASLHRLAVEIVDINRLFVPLVLNPGRFGFTNSSGYALNPNTGGGDTNQNDYVFWDGFHPTTNAHLVAAQFIYKEIVSKRTFPDILSLAHEAMERLSP